MRWISTHVDHWNILEVFYNDGKARKFEVTLACRGANRESAHQLQTLLLYERGDQVEKQEILEKMERNAIAIAPGQQVELSFRINQGKFASRNHPHELFRRV